MKPMSCDIPEGAFWIIYRYVHPYPTNGQVLELDGDLVRLKPNNTAHCQLLKQLWTWDQSAHHLVNVYDKEKCIQGVEGKTQVAECNSSKVFEMNWEGLGESPSPIYTDNLAMYHKHVAGGENRDEFTRSSNPSQSNEKWEREYYRPSSK